MRTTYTIGELDQRIKIVRGITASDSQGGVTVTESTLATIWAHVRPLSMAERLHSGALEAAQGYLVVIRYRDDILPSDQIEWAGLRLNIKGVSQGSSRSMYTEIQAERGVAV